LCSSLHPGEGGEMRRVVLLLVVAAAVLAMAGGVVSAALVCAGDCVGTRQDDTLTGSTNPDRIAGMEGRDTIDGGAQNDEIYGDEGNDTIKDVLNAADNDFIYGDEGNDTINVQENDVGIDTVNCGPGTKDKVFFDTNFDTINQNCEIRRGS
jgi:Ca2+-binding RTX toxin-like protein